MAEAMAEFIGGTWAERPRGPVPDNLPVVLRSATLGKISRGRFRPSWSQRYVMVKWVTSGQAAIRVSGRRVLFGPAQMAVYLPTVPHEFWTITHPTEMCWFTLDGALCEQFGVMLGLRAGVYSYGPPPLRQIKQMVESLQDQSLTGRRRSSQLAISLLYEVVSHIPQPPAAPVVQQVQHLIREGLADPELCAKRIAAALKYNRSALSRIFHKHTGTTIMHCITRARLQEANLLLTQTSDPIAEIARKCGFCDRSYFTRWIRKHTSHLPTEIRGSI